MTHRETINEIRKMISEEDLLCQLAEECSELAQAALKLRRTMCGSNPTPVTHSEAVEALLEEAGDVLLCLRMIQETKDNWYVVDIGITEKAERWLNRLQEAKVRPSAKRSTDICRATALEMMDAVSEYIESVKYELCMTNGLEENRKIFEVLERIWDKYATQKASEEE